ARRISDSGSSSRRQTAPATLARLGAASALGPYCSRRAAASTALSPTMPQRNSADSASLSRVQNGARASASIMPDAGYAHGRRTAAHGGDGGPSFAIPKGDNCLAIKSGGLAGTLGDEIEAQDHDPARRHGIKQA